ncbi:hypothetical protein [Streptomyces collinus]
MAAGGLGAARLDVVGGPVEVQVERGVRVIRRAAVRVKGRL